MAKAIDFSDDLRIGYALGGGGARGLSHIGVMKVLEEHGIYPNVIAGTSIGALVGALYASGLRAGDIERALRLDLRRLAMLADVTWSLSGLVKGNRVATALESFLGDLSFADLKIPFACVATDIIHGQEITIRSGPVITAVRASISVPGLFTPVKVRGRYLVDGGLVNMVPVSTCRDMGAEYVVGINVIPDPAGLIHESEVHQDDDHEQDESARRSRSRKSTQAKSSAPNVVKVLIQSLYIPGYRIAMENLEAADLAISPEVGNIGFFQFDKEVEAIEAGERAARKALEEAGI
ncbi:MAG: patatin-like phospholipase family protein [Dehalococcoidia bacterium]|nr:patatin-like phospholipase family protein [Dehalococcoidia bacterium]